MSPPAVAEARLSFDSGRSSPPINGLNGALNGRQHNDGDDQDEDLDPVQRLQLELERTIEQKEHLAMQYQTLLGKLTNMRTTLGNKLKQDAVRGPV
jgi:hypothetical protein